MTGSAGDVRRRGVLLAGLLLPLSACAGPGDGIGRPTAAPARTTPASSPSSVLPAAPSPSVEDLSGPNKSAFARLEKKAASRLGVWGIDTGSGRAVGYRASERFAMCSTFKPLAVSALLAHDPESLGKRLTYKRADLLPHSPITEKHVSGGMTIRELCDAAIRYSDNTAANLLLRELGGPDEVTAFVRSLGDDVTRLDRVEPSLNAAIPGDPRDTSSPAAIGATYRALAVGDALPPEARDSLNGWLAANTTGDAGIRASAPKGWDVGDKTGSGGYGTNNDVAVVRPPGGRAPIVLAIMTDRPTADAKARPELIAEAAALAIAALK